VVDLHAAIRHPIPVSIPVTVRAVTDEDQPWLKALIDSDWGLPVVSVSGSHDPTRLPGFVAQLDSRRVGAVTYRITPVEVEVITLNSVVEDMGVGSALLAKAVSVARDLGVRLCLVTTNNNIRAIRFYQRRGMNMVAFHRDFQETVRRLKPNAAAGSRDGIPSRHALEFEYPAPLTPSTH
jgi:GNAT superfamily N-acetyltransferase